MVSLALDHEVVASAWEQQVGCGSIFSDPEAEHTVPNFSLDLSEIQASMQAQLQPSSSTNTASTFDNNACGLTTDSAKGAAGTPEQLSFWNAVLPLPLVGSPTVPASSMEPAVPAAASAGQQYQLVPDNKHSLSSATNSRKIPAPWSAADAPPAKRAKPATSSRRRLSASAQKQWAPLQPSEQDAADAELGVVPDALAGAAPTCSSDSSSGPAGAAVAGTAAAAVAAAAAAAASAPATAPDAATGTTTAPTGSYANQAIVIPATPASLICGMIPTAAPQQTTKPDKSSTSPAPSAAAAATATPSKGIKPAWIITAVPVAAKPAGHAGSSAAAAVTELPARPAHHAAAGEAAAAAAGSAAAASGGEGFVRTRTEALARYRAKRARRSHTKIIRYHLRKVNADKRPRIKGRFVKKAELGKMAVAEAVIGSADGASGSGGWGAAGSCDAAEEEPGTACSWEQEMQLFSGGQLPGDVVTEDAADASGCSAELDPAAAAAAEVAEAVLPWRIADKAAAAAAGEEPAATVPELGMLPSQLVLFGGAAAAEAAVEPLADDAAPIAMLGQLPLDLEFYVMDDAHGHMLADGFFNDGNEGSDASHTCHSLLLD